MIQIPVSNGELVDKVTILRIKRRRICDEARLQNVERELSLLESVLARALPVSPELQSLTARLTQINETLWEVEDALRERESRGAFDDTFITLARSVYQTNDERNLVKRAIDRLTGSLLTEEKSYARPLEPLPLGQGQGRPTSHGRERSESAGVGAQAGLARLGRGARAPRKRS